MPRKPNRKTKHYLLPELLKSASKDNLHPEFGLKKTAMRIRLEASQIAGLRKLARRNGTMVTAELGNAIDAYLLGITPGEIRLLNALIDRLNVSTARANKALDAALREIAKSRARLARQERAKGRA